jgi:DNA topoisomerase-1
MIWQRFVASQMAQALIDQKTLSIAAGDYTFTASGSSVKFPGFLAVYQSADDEAESSKKSQPLPELAEKSLLDVLKIDPKQHFTQPPPRFSEASLVKELEENGIGRPSTYAAILSTIRDKGYVELVNAISGPRNWDSSSTICSSTAFPDILDVEFTARLETDLDRVEQSEVEALTILNQFYGPFSRKLAEAGEGMLSVKGVGLPTGLTCPLCKKMNCASRWVKTGTFWPAPDIPNARTPATTNAMRKASSPRWPRFQSEATDKVCELCGKPMVVKRGRYGDFIACTGYPECKHTQSLNGGANAKSTGVACPEAGCDGEVVEKSSKRGKIFYGCNRIPNAVSPAGTSRLRFNALPAAMPTWWKKPPNGTAPSMSAPTVSAVTAMPPESGELT